jgi:shikimate kinase
VDGIIGTGTGLSERALALGALAAGITGTGPAVAVVAKKGDGKRIAEELGCRYILTETR